MSSQSYGVLPATWHKWTNSTVTHARQVGTPAHGRKSNPWPVDHKSDAIATTLPSHCNGAC